MIILIEHLDVDMMSHAHGRILRYILDISADMMYIHILESRTRAEYIPDIGAALRQHMDIAEEDTTNLSHVWIY